MKGVVLYRREGLQHPLPQLQTITQVPKMLLCLKFNIKHNKFAFTWKNAIPKDIPAMIPKLDSIAVVTREKQPCNRNEAQQT